MEKTIRYLYRSTKKIMTGIKRD